MDSAIWGPVSLTPPNWRSVEINYQRNPSFWTGSYDIFKRRFQWHGVLWLLSMDVKLYPFVLPLTLSLLIDFRSAGPWTRTKRKLARADLLARSHDLLERLSPLWNMSAYEMVAPPGNPPGSMVSKTTAFSSMLWGNYKMVSSQGIAPCISNLKDWCILYGSLEPIKLVSRPGNSPGSSV